MTSIAFCSVFSDLSNEMLFKKIHCEMADKKHVLFSYEKKTPVFLKTLYLGQKTFFFSISLVVIVSQ